MTNHFANFASDVARFVDTIVYPAIDQRMRASGEAWVSEATSLCPVDTGQLRDSIGYIYDQKTRKLTLYADKYYAVFVEFGTRYRRAQPFMRPALKSVGQTWGVTSQFQMGMTQEKYKERTNAYAKKVTKTKVHLGHFGVRNQTRPPRESWPPKMSDTNFP